MKGLLALLILCGMGWADTLEVHFEERHSGSFFHFADSLDLDGSYTLVLIDAHSDASGVRDSDRIRRELRAVASRDARRERLLAWRKSGRVQVFDWIEPLMPQPIERVLWVGGEGLLDEARAHIDRDAKSREAGELTDRWTVATRENWTAQLDELDESERVVVSLDLDYFAGWEREKARAALRDFWREILALPGLEGMSVALSLPWLRDEAEARFLAGEFLQIALGTP
jgi:hypothetical protein